LHSTSPPVAPAEDDDCKSSIPGCRRSATIVGVACGLSGHTACLPKPVARPGCPAGNRVGMGMPIYGACRHGDGDLDLVEPAPTLAGRIAGWARGLAGRDVSRS
jgi:hypothetical protein